MAEEITIKPPYTPLRQGNKTYSFWIRLYLGVLRGCREK